ncbi:AAA family ATPase [Thermicanus aegyptius]|uniref:nucleotide-binding protein n=1 Tax=Thermicanus aegyptius TaxID=94009 RepID=UPI00041A38CE|nr:AAA family ATPase [Thermicanus aegyptius]
MNVLLAGDSGFIDEQQRNLREMGHNVVALATSIPKAADLFRSAGYDGVFLGFPLEDAVTLLKDIKPKAGAKVWVLVNAINLDVWKALAPLGAIPVVHGMEKETLKTTETKTEEKTDPTEEDDVKKKDIAARKMKVSEKTAKFGVLKHRIFAVYSPKGGVGKTTLATFLGYSIAKNTNLKVSIIDLDHTREGSDVARKFGLFSITDDMQKIKTIVNFHRFPEKEYRSWDKIRDFLQETSLPSLYYLASPMNVEDNELITAELTEKVAYILKNHFDILIFDLADDLRGGNVKAMEISDAILFVSGADIDSIDISSGFIRRTVTKLNLPLEKFRLVLNQIPDRPLYTLQSVSEKIGLPLFAEIPEDPELRKWRTEKNAVTDAIFETKYGKALKELTKNLLPEGSFVAKKKQSFLSRLFGRKEE